MSSVEISLLADQKVNFIKVTEELRYARESCNQLEKNLKDLHHEKLEKEKKSYDLQTELNKSQALVKELQQATTKNSDNGEDFGKVKSVLAASEDTIACLKNKILNYNMSRAEQDKKLADSEHNLYLCKQNLGVVNERIVQLQVTVDKLKRKFDQTDVVQDKLEINVKIANNINSTLAMSLNHKNCIIERLEKEKAELKNQLLESNSKLKIQNQEVYNRAGNNLTNQISLDSTIKENENRLKDSLSKAQLDLLHLTELAKKSVLLSSRSKNQEKMDNEVTDVDMNIIENFTNKRIPEDQIKDENVQETN